MGLTTFMSINTIYKTINLIILAFDQCVVSNGDTLKVMNLVHT